MRYLTVFLVLSFCINTWAQNRFNPNELKLEWKIIRQNTNSKKETLVNFTVVNGSKIDFPLKGWTVFFNAGDVYDNMKGGPISVRHINGDLFALVPNGTLKVIPAGKSVEISIVSRAAKNITDFPKGFYWTWDDQNSSAIPLKVKMETVVDVNEEERKLADEIYTQNRAIVGTSKDQLIPVFPTPVHFTKGIGFFYLDKTVRIVADKQLNNEKKYLIKEISKVLKNVPEKDVAGRKTIELRLDPSIADDAYQLQVNTAKITITSGANTGVFYGIQSLKSLMPLAAWSKKGETLNIASINITDEPRFGHRAFMMDVARNFQPKKTVLKTLDLMAMYKLNKFHFHITDDEGWRLEIPGLPELTAVGAYRGHALNEQKEILPAYGSGPSRNNKTGSGYYSRADFVEILKYATANHIEVITEIETPGHARAAIKAMDARYQYYKNRGEQQNATAYLLRDTADRSIYRSVQGFNDNVINVALPSTYRFLTKITDELIAMYKEAHAPLNTIHFGGDEVPAGVWEKSPAVMAVLNSNSSISSVDEMWYYYFNKINLMLKERGLYLSGWEEIGLRKTLVNGKKTMIVDPRFASENFHVDVWNNQFPNEDLAYRMANAGYKVVLSNVSNLYLDLAYNTSYFEPGQYWGGYVDVDKPFNFIPFDYLREKRQSETSTAARVYEKLTEAGKNNIVGMQAPLWSEIIKNQDQFEYLLLPKLFGLIERAWAKDPAWVGPIDSLTYKQAYQKDWSNFINVLAKKELPRLDYYNGGYNYRIPTVGLKNENGLLMANIRFAGFDIRYTTDGSEPSIKSKIYIRPLVADGNYAFRAFNRLGRGGRTIFSIPKITK